MPKFDIFENQEFQLIQLWKLTLDFFIKKKIVGIQKGPICDQWQKIWMIYHFSTMFERPLKISGEKIKMCRNFDECNFWARGSKFPMAAKSRILKLECSQATWTFIDHTSKGRSKENSQKQSSLRLLPTVSIWPPPTLICNSDDPPFSGLRSPWGHV